MDHREGMVDVDAIPSLQVYPMSLTLVEEEAQASLTVDMEIDLHDSAQGRQTRDASNLLPPVRAEVAHKKNGYAS
jgi:hypothetical protein